MALSADGTTALIGGGLDNPSTGAAWVFVEASDAFQVRYASKLTLGDSAINLVNTGAMTLSTNLAATGNICANIYAFDSSEELISCCSFLVTPNGLNSLSAKTDLVSNVLTSGTPNSIVIKLLATSPLGQTPEGTGRTCNAATPAGPGLTGLVPGLLAWGTTINAVPTVPVSYGITEERFEPSPLSAAEFSKLTLFCGFIQSNGSGSASANRAGP